MPNALRDHIMDNLEDADTTTSPPVVGDALVWDGVNWVPGAAAANFEQDYNETDISVPANTPIAVQRTFTTQSNPAGTYRVALFTHFNGTKMTQIQLWVNGSRIALEYDSNPVSNGTTVREDVYLVGYYVHASAGTFNIELAVGTQPGATTTIRGTQFEVWRMA